MKDKVFDDCSLIFKLFHFHVIYEELFGLCAFSPILEKYMLFKASIRASFAEYCNSKIARVSVVNYRLNDVFMFDFHVNKSFGAFRLRVRLNQDEEKLIFIKIQFLKLAIGVD